VVQGVVGQVPFNRESEQLVADVRPVATGTPGIVAPPDCQEFFRPRAVAVGKDQYVVVEDDELAEIAIESSHTVDIEKFVPKSSIDDRYRDTPYYLAPEDKVGQEAFAVIRDAMAKKKMVGKTQRAGGRGAH
jgi:hypothetical protein